MHDPRALPQGDARRRPARHGCPVRRLCDLEIVHTGDMLDDIAGVGVPDVHAEGYGRSGVVTLSPIQTMARTFGRLIDLTSAPRRIVRATVCAALRYLRKEARQTWYYRAHAQAFFLGWPPFLKISRLQTGDPALHRVPTLRSSPRCSSNILRHIQSEYVRILGAHIGGFSRHLALQ
jgi:hypothetical protein